MMSSDGSFSQLFDTRKTAEKHQLCGRVYRDLIGRLIFKCSMCSKAFPLIAEYAMHLDQHPLASEKPYQNRLEMANLKTDLIKNSPTLIKGTFKLVCDVSFSSGEDSGDADLLSNVLSSTLYIPDEPQSTNIAAAFLPEFQSMTKGMVLPSSKSNTTHSEASMKPVPAKRTTRSDQPKELVQKRPAFEPSQKLVQKRPALEPSHNSVPRLPESKQRISYARSYVPCKLCNKRFSSTQGLDDHMKQFVNDKPGHHICTTCDQKFEAGCLLELHILKKHSHEKRKFACELCGKRYVYQCTLNQHLDSHSGNKPYKCDVCDKSFPHLAYIKIHMRLHTGERPYQCTVCGETFYTTSRLASHMRRQHLGNWKAHQCKICDKKFSYPRQLREHKVTHTGDRPYTCEICSKSFTLPKYIAVHMQTHSGVKPYKCRYCDLTFAQSPNRRQHEKLKHERRPEYDDLVLE